MKKRMLSLLLVLVMLIGMLPMNVLAAEADATPISVCSLSMESETALYGADDGFTEIASVEDFAAMSASGKYRLTKDITVTAPYAGKFTGTFDGDGYTITLNLNVTSGNAGLFAQTGANAVIENLVVDANVTSSVPAGSSYYGTAGLIGNVSGKTTIRNCGVSGSVKNTSSSGVYMGGLVGYAGYALSIENSFCTATLSFDGTSGSLYLGSLVGCAKNKLTVQNCYATGRIQASSSYSSYIGGLVGQAYNSYSLASFQNTYAAVEMTTKAGYGYSFLNLYSNSNSSYYKFENCYYDNTLANGRDACNKTISSGLTGTATADFATLATTLGDAFYKDAKSS